MSFSTLPLAALRKYLTDRGLIPDILDDLEYPLVGLVFYFLSRWRMKLLEDAKQRTEQEVQSSGLATSAQPEKLEKESITETNANGNVNANGNGSGNSKNARKRLTRSQRKARGQNRNSSNQNRNNSNQNKNGSAQNKKNPNQNRNGSNQNGNARSNRNKPPVQLNLNKISRKRLQKTPPISWEGSIRQAVSYFIEHHLEELYFLSLLLLFTREKLPGLEQSPEGDYDQMVARVLITFMGLGTLEPLRCSRWDIEACGLGMFTYCCVFCDEGPGPWKSAAMGAIGLCSIGGLIECMLCVKIGHWVCWPALWLTSDNLSVFDMLVRISALGPLIDIAETITYSIASYTSPVWYASRREFMQRPL
ncbi:hypothetical protein FPOAC1_000646 [Fusarium poae]|uniref:Uncharacterized protein n=1 Tax=Fusarium poae TaxID=36050 RepID=A0A1B8B1S4_FUSPO|nr:hypothetical protein FPOAC1_000646 [Fusarium poae]KAG8674674.1 hypothetical protein FPOAC1_000646 [Fusarium poae]OBS26684.1 hypothetical protein FPOA_00626 [Fusarium poae]